METTAIDFMPVVQQVLMALGSILVGFLTAAAYKLQKKFGMDADEKSIQRVREAIQNGVEYGRDRLEIRIQDKVGLNVKNAIASEAAKYAIAQIPAVIKKLNYDQAHLERWAYSLIAAPRPVEVLPVTTEG